MKETDTQKHVVIRENGVDRPLTSGSEWHLYPDISEAGDRVTMVSGPDADHLAVSVLDLESGRQVKLTAGHGRDLHPTFSGDGKKVAFSEQTGPQARQITVVETPGFANFQPPGGKRTAVPGSEGGYFPALSEDGSFVVYQRSKDKRREIVGYDFRRGQEKVLAEGMSPSLSFDDKWLTYTRKENDQWNIHLQNLETGEQKQVTHTPHLDFAPSFAPDGGLYFASDRSGSFDLYHLSAESIAQGRDDVTVVAQSPDTLYAPESAAS